MAIGSTCLLASNAQHSVLQALGPCVSSLPAHECFGWRKLVAPALGFDGQRTEPLTGRYHLGHGRRVYNPVLRRFHEADTLSPFGAGGLNAYMYCQGDPINYRDPSGAQVEWMDDPLSIIVMPSLTLLYDIFSVMGALLIVANTPSSKLTRFDKTALIGTMVVSLASAGETIAGLITKNDELKLAGALTAGGSAAIVGMGVGVHLRGFLNQMDRWSTFMRRFGKLFDFSSSRRSSVASNQIPMTGFGAPGTRTSPISAARSRYGSPLPAFPSPHANARIRSATGSPAPASRRREGSRY